MITNYMTRIVESAEERKRLLELRKRATKLAEESEYAKKYVKMLKENVLGANGIRVSDKPRNVDENSK